MKTVCGTPGYCGEPMSFCPPPHHSIGCPLLYLKLLKIISLLLHCYGHVMVSKTCGRHLVATPWNRSRSPDPTERHTASPALWKAEMSPPPRPI